MRTFPITVAILASLTMVAASGCRGQVSEQPPVHLNPNMDSQPRYDGLAESAFFADHRVARTPPKGTVPVGHLDEDDAIHRGLDSAGEQVALIPIQVDAALIDRGEKKYAVYCAPCHSSVGDGQGLVGKRWPFPVPSFHDQARFDGVSDGRIYSAIYNGYNSMPSYRFQIPDAQDRWAVVAYVRTLQRARDAAIAEVPPADRAKLQ